MGLKAISYTGAATSVPVSGITGLGTGVATALAVNVGTAGAFVVNGGTQIPFAGVYKFTNWNPSDTAGARTAPSSTTAATIAATGYMTQANSSGVLTITFTKAGNYVIQVNGTAAAAATFTSAYLEIGFGGTGTLITSQATQRQYGVGGGTNDFTGSWQATVTATANQTVTITPIFSVTQGGGTASNYTAGVTVTATYAGT